MSGKRQSGSGSSGEGDATGSQEKKIKSKNDKPSIASHSDCKSSSSASGGSLYGKSTYSELQTSPEARMKSSDSGISSAGSSSLTSKSSSGAESHSASSGYFSSPVSVYLDLEDDDNAEEAEPRNFSWVVDGLLCACAFPTRKGNFRYLENRGVTHIVSLTAEIDLEEKYVKDFEVTRLRVKDFTPPSMEQILRFVEVVEKAEGEGTKVAVHCAAGKGRTGTVVACFLVKRFSLTDQEAITNLRLLRPGSVETNEQEDVVKRFYERLQSKAENDESPCPRPVNAGSGDSPRDVLLEQFKEKVRLVSDKT